MLSKVLYSSVFLLLIVGGGFGYYNYSKQNSIKTKAIADSGQYYDIVFKIHNVEDLKDISLSNTHNFESSIYKTLSTFILTNQDFVNGKINVDADLLEKHIKNNSTDPLLKDLLTISYAKILLNRMDLPNFEKYMISELSNKTFSYHDNATELLDIYYIISKDYKNVEQSNVSNIQQSFNPRINILSQEVKFLEKIN